MVESAGGAIEASAMVADSHIPKDEAYLGWAEFLGSSAQPSAHPCR